MDHGRCTGCEEREGLGIGLLGPSKSPRRGDLSSHKPIDEIYFVFDVLVLKLNIELKVGLPFLWKGNEG